MILQTHVCNLQLCGLGVVNVDPVSIILSLPVACGVSLTVATLLIWTEPDHGVRAPGEPAAGGGAVMCALYRLVGTICHHKIP